MIFSRAEKKSMHQFIFNIAENFPRHPSLPFFRCLGYITVELPHYHTGKNCAASHFGRLVGFQNSLTKLKIRDKFWRITHCRWRWGPLSMQHWRSYGVQRCALLPQPNKEQHLEVLICAQPIIFFWHSLTATFMHSFTSPIVWNKICTEQTRRFCHPN